MLDIIANSESGATVNSELILSHTNAMKYPDYAKKFRALWNECEEAPKVQKELAKWLGFSQPAAAV